MFFIQLGMTEMFTETTNLGGLSEGGDSVFISDVLHKVFIEVNEAGSEATAATGNEMNCWQFGQFK